MTPERWAEVNDVLHRAMQLGPEDRPAFLENACASDSSLRHEVESLLSADDQVRSSFLESRPGAGLAKGSRLGDYEIQSLLGSGGMGEVYRARDLRLRREVAIKVLPAFVSLNSERLRRFEQEAMAAAALNHPNILAVYQMGTYEGTPYLVSELLEGGTLREQIRNGRIALRKAIDYGVQVARGLAAAHEKGIVHRDLKPENLFVTKDGRVKVLDFGLAKLGQPRASSAHSALTAGEQTEPGMVMGTVGYMSPEQVRGQTADHRADIFAFGTILYEMLTGQRAFQKPTSAETMTAILNEEPVAISQRVPDTPLALQRIVQRCLEKNPERRFQSASDLAFAQDGLSESSSASSGLMERPASRHTWWLVGAATAIIVIGAVLAWLELRPAVLAVGAITQLSDDGIPKTSPLVTDGSRIYFNEGATGSWKIAQVAVTGGETAAVQTRLASPQIRGVVPDGSSLLALVGGWGYQTYTLWRIPLPAGEPRRIGTVEAQDARFFPNGRVAFAQGTGLYVSEKDGSNVHKLLDAPDDVFCPQVSPDGKRIALRTRFAGDVWDSLAEADADGSNLKVLLKGAEDARLSCPVWTADGKSLLFSKGNVSRRDIWVLPTQGGFLHHNRQAAQLTNGPLLYRGLALSRDGRRIFAIGTKQRGELVRYDARVKEFLPFLSGISAIDPTFSRDGTWVAYVSYPDQTLWRSRADGTDRLQLTYPPMEVSFPFISPDGKQVCFTAGFLEQYVIGMDGGSLRKIAGQGTPVAGWSPDGNSLVLTSLIEGKHAAERNSQELRIFDLRNSKLSVIPSSQGMGGAWWMTDDKLLAATDDNSKFLTFDFKTGKWTELLSGNFVNWAPSLDSKYFYYTTGGPDPKAMRIRLADRRVEEITSLQHLRRVVDPRLDDTQISVAPDGSAVFTRDIGSEEIYALDVSWR